MKNKSKEFAVMKVSDLHTEIEKARKELHTKKVQYATNPPKDSNELGKLRRSIAQMATYLKQHQLGILKS